MVNRANIKSESTLSKLADQSDVYDITAFTALDFPDHLAAILWFAGCNLACGYCYNLHIVDSRGRITAKEVFDFLRSRVGFLEGVVLSGGEATNCKNIIDYADAIKKLGYKVKLDTNGTNPEVLANLLKLDLIDYVAIDFKAPKHKWQLVTNRSDAGFDKFLESFELLKSSKVEFEVRTTFHSDLLDLEDIKEMVSFLDGYNRPLFVQEFRDAPTIGNLGSSKKVDLSSIDGVEVR